MAAARRTTQLERLQRLGIRRTGSASRGFRYTWPDGRRASAAERGRIEALRLPPAWRDVLVSPSARAPLQAMGRDARGRWQYRYHASHTSRRAQTKYARLADFGRALPRLRRRVNADLRRRGLVRERVMAALLRILGTCFIRPGSQRYAEENGSFGLATLRREHVRVQGDTVHFDFPGKSGKHHHRTLRDRRVAAVVRECLRTPGPGPDVFKFVLDDGFVVDVRRRHINEYIHEVMGAHYSAKDFRTWAGTLLCACALARARSGHATAARAASGMRALRRHASAAVREVAEHLGNTPAVARASYICPSVLDRFEQGRVLERYLTCVDELSEHDGAGLHAAEEALLALLDEATSPAAAAAAG